MDKKERNICTSRSTDLKQEPRLEKIEFEFCSSSLPGPRYFNRRPLPGECASVVLVDSFLSLA